MRRFDEAALEQIVVDKLAENGFDYVSGDDIDRDLRDVLIRADLFAYLQSRYPELADAERTRFLKTLDNYSAGESALYDSNRNIMRLISDGIVFRRDNPENKDVFICLIDYDAPDKSDKALKIVCRYPQYYATNKLYDNVLKHVRIGDNKGGTYFGATGCGKSFTMLFLCRKLMRSSELNNPTILIISDRIDLDDQLSEQFLNAKKFINDDAIVQIENRELLGQNLRGRESGGLFLTTVQKFTESAGLLSNRRNIIVISDEAHRSQTDIEKKIKVSCNGVEDALVSNDVEDIFKLSEKTAPLICSAKNTWNGCRR